MNNNEHNRDKNQRVVYYCIKSSKASRYVLLAFNTVINNKQIITQGVHCSIVLLRLSERLLLSPPYLTRPGSIIKERVLI